MVLFLYYQISNIEWNNIVQEFNMPPKLLSQSPYALIYIKERGGGRERYSEIGTLCTRSPKSSYLYTLLGVKPQLDSCKRFCLPDLRQRALSQHPPYNQSAIQHTQPLLIRLFCLSPQSGLKINLFQTRCHSMEHQNIVICVILVRSRESRKAGKQVKSLAIWLFHELNLIFDTLLFN